MSKDSRAASLAQVKKTLSKLKKAGLYKPTNGRAAPTKYAKSLAKKFADVSAGNAFVLKASKKAIEENRGLYRTARGRLVIEKDALTQRAYVEKKTGRVIKTGKIGDARFVLRPAGITQDRGLPGLQPGERYVVPFKRGKGPMATVTYANDDELLAVLNDYEKRKDHKYKDMFRNVMIAKRVA